MNSTVLIGRICRDVELRYLPNGGTAVAKFSLAVDRGLSKQKKEEAESKGWPTCDFINITAWGKTGELVAEYCSKGSQIAVAGRIQTGSYEKDGQKRYTTEVVAQNVKFLGGKSDQAPRQDSGIEGFDIADDSEDIPF